MLARHKGIGLAAERTVAPDRVTVARRWRVGVRASHLNWVGRNLFIINVQLFNVYETQNIAAQGVSTMHS